MSAPNSVVKVGNVEIGNALKLAIIAGPCQLESRAHALEMASALKEMAAKAGVGLIYKTSFDKANVRDGHYTVWSPTMSPPRNEWMPISRVVRAPTMPCRP